MQNSQIDKTATTTYFFLLVISFCFKFSFSCHPSFSVMIDCYSLGDGKGFGPITELDQFYIAILNTLLSGLLFTVKTIRVDPIDNRRSPN